MKTNQLKNVAIAALALVMGAGMFTGCGPQTYNNTLEDPIYLCLAYLTSTAMADGEITLKESEGLEHFCQEFRPDQSIDELAPLLLQEAEPLLEAVKAGTAPIGDTKELNQAILNSIATMALYDGEINDDEDAFYTICAQRFGISEEEAVESLMQFIEDAEE